MSSEAKSKSNSKAKSVNQTEIKNDESYSSKKKNLRPLEEDEETNKENSHSKKFKTSTKGKSSTYKKGEVTFSEKIEQIEDNSKENNGTLTPNKGKSASKSSLKSVKERQKTPYSKIKDDNEEKVIESPSFNKEDILNLTAKKTTEKKVEKSEKKNSTPVKSSRKSVGKSRSKSPLIKINEDKDEDVADSNKKKDSKRKESISKSKTKDVEEFRKNSLGNNSRKNSMTKNSRKNSMNQ
jgi:hypothetical protein